MIPESLLKFSTAQGVIVPRYLDERDHPWLRLLIEEYLRFVGSSKIELLQHLKRPLPFISPDGKRQLAVHILNRLFRAEVKSKIQPSKIRAAVFEFAAASESVSRESTIQTTAESLELSPTELETFLFCDLPNERIIKKPEEELQPSTIALRANSFLIQSFLARSMSVSIELEGNARKVVRQAKLCGLICEVSHPKTTLTISGPYALFRRTFVYGRSLGQLLPHLSWCNRFRLRARCILGEKEFLLEVHSGDPIFPSKTPKLFDSKVEEKFARSFLKLEKNWDLIPEPEPIKSNETIIFPDFLLRERANPTNTWFLEIVGFWMPDYIKKKMSLLKQANLKKFILCVDDSLSCSQEEVPQGAYLVRFKKTIKPETIRKIIQKEEVNCARKNSHAFLNGKPI